MKKQYKTILLVIILGVLFGILAKVGDVNPQGDIFKNILSGFGRASSGFTLWIFMSLLISNKSINKKYAVINVLLFLTSMLIAYYTYSKFVVGYLSLGIVKFWMLMLIPSGIASYLVYDIKNKKLMKILVVIATIILGISGIIFIEGIELYALIIEIILFILIGIILFKKELN